jgi:N-hydroxyarylamine O-acetyltransferase
MNGATEGLDLSAYLERVAWRGRLEPTLETLGTLHLAHQAAIPFENLDVQLGIPIRLDLASLQDKLVARRRGGYCFEHNTLFAAVLEHLGFQVTLREARVRRGATRPMPRTHLSLRVDLPGGAFLVDVGFGADGPLGPVPLSGEAARWEGDAFRVAAEGPLLVLQALRGGAWLDLYAVEPGPLFQVDLDMANHYTSTHPDSRFVQTLTAQRTVPGRQWILRDLDLTLREGGAERLVAVPREELLPTLRERFGLVLPAGTRFRCQDR